MNRAPGVSLEMFTRSVPDGVLGPGGKSWIRPPSPHRLRHSVVSAIDSQKVGTYHFVYRVLYDQTVTRV